jgi:prepilin-type N-terminal cleavage/methylation domain
MITAVPDNNRPESNRPGFSMVELMVVVIVIAVLAMMAIPATMSIVPYARVRMEAQNAAAIMRQARLKAANTQRPTRVVLECFDHVGNANAPCIFSMQTATYTEGVLTGWDDVPVGGMDMVYIVSPAVTAKAATGNTSASVFWVVFMPSSRAFASHVPYEIDFTPTRAAAHGQWKLSVNSSSGRTTLVYKK